MLHSVKATQSISVGIHATHTWYTRPTLSTYTLRYMSPTRVHVHVTGPNEYIHATHTWYMSYILTVHSTFTMCKWFGPITYSVILYRRNHTIVVFPILRVE